MTNKTTTKTRGIEAPDYDSFIRETPLWSEVLPGLWQGGTHDDDIIGDPTFAKPFVANAEFITKQDFDTVVTLYQYANPAGWFVKEYRWCVYDATIEMLDVSELLVTAKFAYDAWKRGERTLVRCQAGLNRSGLVTALVLMLDGYTAEQAIDLIRTTRSPYALFNKDFVKFLLELGTLQLEKK